MPRGFARGQRGASVQRLLPGLHAAVYGAGGDGGFNGGNANGACMKEAVYGFFHGGDPREFRPDPECSTDAERALHKEHCAAWDRGEQPEVAVSGWEGNTHVTRSAYGLGSYEVDLDDFDEAAD